MPSAGFILKSNIAIEPLVARYAATSYLLSPCTASRYLRHVFDRILASFIRAPGIHEAALKNKGLQGGPFVVLSRLLAADVENFVGGLSSKIEIQREIAMALDELVLILKTAQGQPLEDVVPKIPTVLAGLVELYYERGGQATYRFVEALAYQSSLYDSSLQEVLIYPLEHDNRDFIFTTPRFKPENGLILPWTLSSRNIDLLAKARQVPVADLSAFAAKLQISPNQFDLFSSFFEEASGVASQVTRPEGQVDFRYFGHAAVEVSTSQTRVLVDPFISYRLSTIADGRLSFNDLPDKIDAIVITHAHPDHFSIETLIQLRHKTSEVMIPKTMGGSPIDPSLKRILFALGFRKVTELEEFEGVEVGDLTITALPFQGEHGDLAIMSKAMIHIAGAGQSALFAADARFYDSAMVRRTQAQTGNVDTLFLGMESEGAPLSWVYGPMLDQPVEPRWDRVRRLNGSDCALGYHLAESFGAKQINIYALGRETWMSHLMKVDASPDSKVQIEIDRFLNLCARASKKARVLRGQA